MFLVKSSNSKRYIANNAFDLKKVSIAVEIIISIVKAWCLIKDKIRKFKAVGSRNQRLFGATNRDNNENFRNQVNQWSEI